MGLALETAKAVSVPEIQGVELALETARAVPVPATQGVGLEAAFVVSEHPTQEVGLESTRVVSVPATKGVKDEVGAEGNVSEGILGPKVQATRANNKMKTNREFFILNIPQLLSIYQ